MEQKTILNFIDLFSGAGGLSCGMELAGHKCLLGIDNNKDAIKTFSLNHKHAKGFCGNISNITEARLNALLNNQKVDCIVGGPPCQGFSTVGLGNPDDKRNSLFLEFVRMVKILNPRYIVVENVTGLIASKNEDTLKAIIGEFTKLGYHLGIRILSSENYGVPEIRKRTIIIGSNVHQDILFPKATHNIQTKTDTLIPAKTVGDALQELEALQASSIKNHILDEARITKDLDREIIQYIPEGKGIRYQADEEKFLPPTLRLGVDWENIRENRLRQTNFQRLDRKKPSPTIMTAFHTYYHPTENRYLTAREAASIQSFPIDFEFCGKRAAQWKQIGNAVPPLLGKAIGNALIEMEKIVHNKKKLSTTDSNTNLSKLSLEEEISRTIAETRRNAFIYSGEHISQLHKRRKVMKNKQNT